VVRPTADKSVCRANTRLKARCLGNVFLRRNTVRKRGNDSVVSHHNAARFSSPFQTRKMDTFFLTPFQCLHSFFINAFRQKYQPFCPLRLKFHARIAAIITRSAILTRF
jgi:hypothetical protein